MLTSFSVENYRSFAEETTIDLRPLTLLFGYNNAGKSALIRALALIADSMTADAGMPLNLESEAARGCTFSELCSKITGRNAITLRFDFAAGKRIAKDQLTRASYRLTQPVGTYEQIIEQLQLEFVDTGARKRCFELSWTSRGAYSVAIDGHASGSVMMELSGLALDGRHASWTLEEESHEEQLQNVIANLMNQLLGLRRTFQWIGSVRNYPARTVQYKGGVVRRISSAGAGIVELLVQDKLVNGPLLAGVSRWYEENFNRKLDVKQLPDGRFALTLEPLIVTGDRAVNIADTGEGIAQVLPVLAAAAMARRHEGTDPVFLAIEQPELHLHPAVHASLAKYLCDIATTKRPRMLIETHSENFLLGVQIQIARREISPEDVLIYWVTQDHDGSSRVHRITFDEDGYPRGFPKNVFHEDLELARVLLDLRDKAIVESILEHL